MSPMQCSIDVYSLPSSVKPSQLCGTVAVVIDVLRATTVFTYAVHSGIREIVPVREVAEAMRLKENYPPDQVLLGGERQGLPIQGFDLGNSPQHYTPERVAGKTLIFTTTNGTVAMYAAKTARSICIASFLNAAAVVEHLQSEGNVAIICAGTNGVETEEDLLLAGCLTARLCQDGLHKGRNYQLNEAATRAAELWREPVSATELEKLLRESTGGKNLLSIGLEDDIAFASQLDTIDMVPLLDPTLLLPTQYPITK